MSSIDNFLAHSSNSSLRTRTALLETGVEEPHLHHTKSGVAAQASVRVEHIKSKGDYNALVWKSKHVWR